MNSPTIVVTSLLNAYLPTRWQQPSHAFASSAGLVDFRSSHADLAQGRVEVSADLVLDAAVVSQLDDGTRSPASAGPCNHAGMCEAASSHRHREHTGPATDEDGFAVAWQTSTVPSTTAADPLLQAMLQACAVSTAIVNEVNVELLDAAMVHWVHNQCAATAPTAPMRGVHAGIVVAHVAAIDIFDASATAPHLVATLGPSTPGALRTELIPFGIHLDGGFVELGVLVGRLSVALQLQSIQGAVSICTLVVHGHSRRHLLRGGRDHEHSHRQKLRQNRHGDKTA